MIAVIAYFSFYHFDHHINSWYTICHWPFSGQLLKAVQNNDNADNVRFLLWCLNNCLDHDSSKCLFCFQHPTREHLYKSLGLWMKHVAEDKLQVYLERLGVQHFQEKQSPHSLSMCRSLLQGLSQAMALPNPPKNCWTVLCSTTEKIYSILPNQIQVN